MKTVKLDLSEVKFATIDGNRDIAPQRLMKAIRKTGRVLVPILVVRYEDFDEDVTLYDMRTGQHLEIPEDDYYVIVDGQHRSMCALQLFERNQKGAAKFTDYIYANVLEKDDIQEQDIMSIIMEINSTPKCWTSKDYVKSAYKNSPQDETLITLNLCTQLGFSISCASRYICYNHKTLNPQVLSSYISGEGNLPECDPRTALENLRMLYNVGFSIKFLRKRYLADALLKKHNANRLDEFLNSLYHLDSETVKTIENLSPQDYENQKIREVVLGFEDKLDTVKRAEKFNADLSDERFSQNVDYFNKMVEELKTTKGQKKIRKSTKNGCKKFENCTIEDVK
jgi:hypothetical protein